MRVLELFCGIGGCAAALPEGAEVVLAVDQSASAAAVYRLNRPGTVVRELNLEHATADALASARADLWWMSPPCQPYTVRGAGRDLDDSRATSFRRLLRLLPDCAPRRIALENVEGFVASRARDAFLAVLRRLGYRLRERVLCPTDLGVPMRRPRYFVVAARGGNALSEWGGASRPRALSEHVGADPGPDLDVPRAAVERFGKGFRLLDPAGPGETTCFTSAYGRSLMRSGSYLRTPRGTVRFFSPDEVTRLLGFPESFRFPREMPLRKRWALAGNSVSVDAVRATLAALM